MKIKTIDTELWSLPDENHRVKMIGRKTFNELFEELHVHLEKNNLLPDEYFIISTDVDDANVQVPEFRQALCNTDFGESEGIYTDVVLRTSEGNIHFATGKTLGETADDFYRMTRIGAEISLMLNGRGNEIKTERHCPLHNGDYKILQVEEVTDTDGVILGNVLAVNNKAQHSMYATWEYNYFPKSDYFSGFNSGHYFDNELLAKSNFYLRCQQRTERVIQANVKQFPTYPDVISVVIHDEEYCYDNTAIYSTDRIVEKLKSEYKGNVTIFGEGCRRIEPTEFALMEQHGFAGVTLNFDTGIIKLRYGAEDDESILMKNISMKSLMNQQVEEQFSQEQM